MRSVAPWLCFLKVDSDAKNWPLLYDVKDKIVIGVVDTDRAIPQHSRPGVVEAIAKTAADIPVDVGGASANQAPAGHIDIGREIENTAHAGQAIDPGLAVTHPEPIEDPPRK